MPKLADDGIERTIGMVRRTLQAQAPVRLGTDMLAHHLDQSGLADAGFTRYQHHLTDAALHLLPPVEQQCQFLLAPDKAGEDQGQVVR